MRRFGHVLIFLFGLGVLIYAQQVTIERTGSTNTPPVKLSVDAAGAAETHVRGEASTKTNIDLRLSQRLFQDLSSVGSLNSLPPTHCVKSVSFGTSLYIEFNGERSPDLNCPTMGDSKTAILKKDVEEIMQATHIQSGPRHPVLVPASPTK